MGRLKGMAMKSRTLFYCTECGNETAKWAGKCPACGAWNTIVEQPELPKGVGKGGSARVGLTRRRACPVTDLAADEEIRFPTGMGELDRVLGGGAVKGSLVLVGGAPGIGKSTLMLQICSKLCEFSKVLYISGEESEHQLKLRAKRLHVENSQLLVLSETNLGDVLEAVNTEQPDVLIVDSIQTLYNDALDAAAGSISQVKDCTMALMQLAKGLGISIFIVGHVTKEGTVAGPRVLEHMVDTVLYFEGDRHASYRILRAVKNRFGSTNEIGVFEMRESGLAEVENPSQFMLNGRPEEASGSIVACSMEGTRPILLEIQALVARSQLAMPRRTAAGMDYNRVNLLLAVLEKRLNLHLSGSDVYVNIAGGIRINEPAIDLGVVLAIVSSSRDQAIDEKVLAFGEVGLSGEVRAVSQAAQRVQEAKKLGFTTVILPEVCREQIGDVKGVRLIGVRSVGDAVRAIS